MIQPEPIKERLSKAFSDLQAGMLAEAIAQAVNQGYEQLVKAKDLHQLMEIVQELGAAQRRTELKVEKLAEAQERAEQVVARLARALEATRADLGGSPEAWPTRWKTRPTGNWRPS